MAKREIFATSGSVVVMPSWRGGPVVVLVLDHNGQKITEWAFESLHQAKSVQAALVAKMAEAARSVVPADPAELFR